MYPPRVPNPSQRKYQLALNVFLKQKGIRPLSLIHLVLVFSWRLFKWRPGVLLSQFYYKTNEQANRSEHSYGQPRDVTERLAVDEYGVVAVWCQGHRQAPLCPRVSAEPQCQVFWSCGPFLRGAPPVVILMTASVGTQTWLSLYFLGWHWTHGLTSGGPKSEKLGLICVSQHFIAKLPFGGEREGEPS